MDKKDKFHLTTEVLLELTQYLLIHVRHLLVQKEHFSKKRKEEAFQEHETTSVEDKLHFLRQKMLRPDK